MRNQQRKRLSNIILEGTIYSALALGVEVTPSTLTVLHLPEDLEDSRKEKWGQSDDSE